MSRGACADHGVDIWITPGNHEDWGRLTTMWASPENVGQPLQLTDHVRVLPRGCRFELGGRSFVSLGGAPSVDLDRRTVGKDWWAEEAITPEDVELVVEGGHADVMLAHDAPLAPYEVAKGRSNPGWQRLELVGPRARLCARRR
jgi:hypothetical protein